MPESWKERKKPACLTKRIEFENYEQTSLFLDQAAEMSEKEDYFPDMSFGRTYVSITLYPKDESGEIDESINKFAEKMDNLAQNTKVEG